ncbi:MAG TPA: hypothetical protein VGF55_24125 [Gemmataceae bacterium]
MTPPDGPGHRRDVLLGTYGTTASRAECARVIAKWEAGGRRPPPSPAACSCSPAPGPGSDAHAVSVTRAGAPRWHPHRLRHMRAADTRRFGLEAAQVVLSHSQADVTQLYAEADLAMAVKIAAEAG